MSTSADGDFIAYHYNPSLPLAITFTAIFACSSALHTYQSVRTRTWYMIPLIIGGILEVIGYSGRIASSCEAPDFQLPAYIVQSIAILIAPALTAASVYIIFGRIVLVVGGQGYSPIRPRLLTLIFVGGDVCSFMVQSTGASVLTQKKPGAAESGKWIILAGLALQVIFFGLFIVLSVVSHRRVERCPTQRSKATGGLWKITLCNVYVVSALILVRSVFRLVEYAQGTDGYLLSREMYLYIFDATLMAVAMLWLNVVHPSTLTGLLKGEKAARLLRVHSLEELDQEEGLRFETFSALTTNAVVRETNT